MSKVGCKPITGSIPDFEIYPKAKAAKSAASAQHIIGWNSIFKTEGNLNAKGKEVQVPKSIGILSSFNKKKLIKPVTYGVHTVPFGLVWY